MTEKNSGVIILPRGAVQEPCYEPYSLTLHQFMSTVDEDQTPCVPIYILKHNDKPLMVVETLRFSPAYGSWMFVPEDISQVPSVCSNGNMTMVTQVDPLFCILVLLDMHHEVNKKSVFQPLDTLCTSADGFNLTDICPLQQIQLLCESTEAVGATFYRLNQEKVLEWLLQKYETLKVHPDIMSDNAIDLIQQYLNPRWQKLFKEHVRGPTEVKEIDAEMQSAKDLALSTMLEDARANNEAARSQENNFDRKKPPTRKSPGKKSSTALKGQKTLSKSWWTSALKPKSKSTEESSNKSGEKKTKRKRSSIK